MTSPPKWSILRISNWVKQFDEAIQDFGDPEAPPILRCHRKTIDPPRFLQQPRWSLSRSTTCTFWSLTSTSFNAPSPTSHRTLHGRYVTVPPPGLNACDFQAFILEPTSSATTPTRQRQSSARLLTWLIVCPFRTWPQPMSLHAHRCFATSHEPH